MRRKCIEIENRKGQEKKEQVVVARHEQKAVCSLDRQETMLQSQNLEQRFNPKR